MSDRLGREHQNRLRQRLLARTLRHARAKVPYYRDLFGASSGELGLGDFPIVDKDLMDREFDRLTAFETMPEVVFTTGGTTRAPIMTLHTRAESDRMLSYLYDLRPGERYPQRALSHFTLHVSIVTQGVVGPPGRPVLTLPLHKRGQIPLIRRVLENGILVGGRRRLVGTLLIPARELKLLTTELAGASFDPAPLRRVLVYSDYLTAPWRALLHDYWGCPPTPVYGLSEFSYAAAPACPECGHFHFPPFVYPELVSPDRTRSLTAGDGVLVLTSLHPFVRGHPHIRYWTGDMVRMGAYCPVAREAGFRLLGRLQHNPVVAEGTGFRSLLSSFDLLEAAERLPELLFDEALPALEICGKPAPAAIGAPLVVVLQEMAGTKGRQVNILWAPRPGAVSDAGQGAERWKEALKGVNGRLAQDLDTGRLQLKAQMLYPDEVRKHPDFQPLS